MTALEKAVRGGASALTLGTVAVRVARVLENRGSVLQFYSPSGPWTLVSAVLFLGPFLTALAAAVSLWLDRERAAGLAAASFCASGFFVLEEALICLARAMNGHAAYVGAEPLFSLFVCTVSGGVVLEALSPRRERKQKRRDNDVY